MRFSVLLPVYSGDKPSFLYQSLQSMLWQTVLPDELVVIVDGPIPRELDNVLSEFVKKKPSIFKVIRLKENMGLGKALSIGLENVESDIVARMDADDIARCDRFEKQLDFIKMHPDVSVVGSYVLEFDDEYKPIHIRKVPLSPKEVMSFAKKRNPINHMTVMFKKEDVIAAGGYVHFPSFEDYHLWVRMILKGFKIANIPDVLVFARTGSGFINRRRSAEYLKREKKLFKTFKDWGFINTFEYLTITYSRTLIRSLPPRVLNIVYERFLRHKPKKREWIDLFKKHISDLQGYVAWQ